MFAHISNPVLFSPTDTDTDTDTHTHTVPALKPNSHARVRSLLSRWDTAACAVRCGVHWGSGCRCCVCVNRMQTGSQRASGKAHKATSWRSSSGVPGMILASIDFSAGLNTRAVSTRTLLTLWMKTDVEWSAVCLCEPGLTRRSRQKEMISSLRIGSSCGVCAREYVHGVDTVNTAECCRIGRRVEPVHIRS